MGTTAMKNMESERTTFTCLGLTLPCCVTSTDVTPKGPGNRGGIQGTWGQGVEHAQVGGHDEDLGGRTGGLSVAPRGDSASSNWDLCMTHTHTHAHLDARAHTQHT